MSRSSNTEDKQQKNPAQKYLKWKSGSSQWKYWDKQEEKEVLLAANTPFIVLDVLSTATGFNDRKGCGVWANEVRSLKLPLRLQDKDGEIMSGVWREIKDKVHYVKFASSVYAVINSASGYELVNFQLSGSALGSWIEFVDTLGGPRKLFGDVVVGVPEVKEGQTGSVRYNIPSYAVVKSELSDEAKAAATKADVELQSYLKSYFAASPEGKAAEEHNKDVASYEAPKPTPAPSAQFKNEEVPF